jgi:hypothetical protein
MNGSIFSEINLKKENHLAASLEKWMRWELVFHFFHLFFHIVPHLLDGEKNICHLGQKKSHLF